ncbi:hypothetical protein [Synechococcus virus S-ESS1]|uniref:GapR-like DNA-binding domain-containing protein n=1 Tax=Synechococcus virus S-ESS1 TaxID=1964565 RepID=A0A1V0DX46_9CAUD|nr:hypothetical protein JT310_gp39 [Synechococcus virus S-ESS1]ARB05729.1 hypothetical protein [Synechococcus virus S-ESS1]
MSSLSEIDDLLSGEDDSPGKGVDAAYRVTSQELRAFIERYERLQAEKQDIMEAQNEVMAEAKGRGYDTKVIKKVIAMRKRNKDDLEEEEAVLQMYLEALGMI